MVILWYTVCSSKLDGSSGQETFCRSMRFQKIITSDHCGFAGVQSPAMRPLPTNIRSPEVSNDWEPVLRRAPASSEDSKTPASLAGVYTCILKRNRLINKPLAHKCGKHHHRASQREDQACYLQRIEGFRASNKAGIHHSLEYARLLDQDPDQGEYAHDREQQHAGFFGSVSQI